MSQILGDYLFWRLAFRNMFRNKRRSFTTSLAILVGFVGLTLLGAYILRAQRALRTNVVYINMQGHLQVHRKGALKNFSISPKKYLITSEIDQRLQNILAGFADKIELKGRFLTGSGLLNVDDKSRPFVALGFERSNYFKILQHAEVTRWAPTWVRRQDLEVSNNLLENRQVISITKKLAELIGRDDGELAQLPVEKREVQLITRNFYQDLNAVSAELGLSHTTGVALAEDTSLRVDLSLLQELLSTEAYQYLVVWLNDYTKLESISDELKKLFVQENLDLEVFAYDAEGIGDFYTGTMNFLYVMGAFFILLICTMVGLSVVNSLTLGFLERTKEIGTMKAMGFSNSLIVRIFVQETFLITMASLFVGFLSAQVISRIVNSAGLEFSPPAVEGALPFELILDIQLYFSVAFGILVVAVFTAWFVSTNKLKKTAIQLLSEAGV